MRIYLFVCGAMGVACADRSLPEDGGDAASEDGPDEDAGPDEEDQRPGESEGMYAACGDPDECAPLDFCVFPAGEEGYCTDRCSSPDDASACDGSPGGSATASCLDIGLPEGGRVCALDCASGRSCPGGMRCEAIDTADGERRICF